MGRFGRVELAQEIPHELLAAIGVRRHLVAVLQVEAEHPWRQLDSSRETICILVLVLGTPACGHLDIALVGLTLHLDLTDLGWRSLRRHLLLTDIRVGRASGGPCASLCPRGAPPSNPSRAGAAPKAAAAVFFRGVPLRPLREELVLEELELLDLLRPLLEELAPKLRTLFRPERFLEQLRERGMPRTGRGLDAEAAPGRTGGAPGAPHCYLSQEVLAGGIVYLELAGVSLHGCFSNSVSTCAFLMLFYFNVMTIM